MCRLKPYYSRKSPVFHFSDSSVFQTCSRSDEACSPIAVRHYRKKRIAISCADDDCIESSHYKWLCTACSKYLKSLMYSKPALLHLIEDCVRPLSSPTVLSRMELSMMKQSRSRRRCASTDISVLRRRVSSSNTYGEMPGQKELTIVAVCIFAYTPV